MSTPVISAPRRSRSVALLILKRPVVAVPVTKPVSHGLQLRMAEWRSRLGCLEPIGRRSSGVAHLPQEKFQRRFSALSGLELRLHASSFLQAPTYSRPVVAGAGFVTGTATTGRFRISSATLWERPSLLPFSNLPTSSTRQAVNSPAARDNGSH
jgi:hypothetical protein